MAEMVNCTFTPPENWPQTLGYPVPEGVPFVDANMRRTARSTVTLADELRFLSLQCHAQTENSSRDEDEAFLENLFGALRSIAPNFALIYRDGLNRADRFGRCSSLTMIRIAERDLAMLAADLDRVPDGRAA